MVTNIQTKIDLYDEVAEDAVLSCLLDRPKLIVDIDLSPEHFSYYKRQDIFRAIAANGGRDVFPPPLIEEETEDFARYLRVDILLGNVEPQLFSHYVERVKAAKVRRSDGHEWQPVPVKDLTGDDLAAELFAADHGVGAWPEPPKQQERVDTIIGTVMTIRPYKGHFVGKLANRHDRKWRICSREYYFRVKREGQKALEHLHQEPMFYLDGLDMFDVDRLVNRWQKRAKRSEGKIKIVYQVYPHDDGYAIVTNQDEASTSMVSIPEKGSIPQDRLALFHLLHRWLDTPEDKTLKRHSQGYGLRYEGMSGDGRLKFAKRQLTKVKGHKLANEFFDKLKAERKKLQLITEMKRDKLTDKLQQSGYEIIKSRFVIEDLNKFKTIIRAIDSKITTRGGDNAWFALDEMKSTQDGHTENLDKTVSSSWVHESGKQPVLQEDPIPF